MRRDLGSTMTGTPKGNSVRWILLCSASFALGCLPSFLAQYPAVLTLDSADQLWQALHMSPFNSWHSPAITLVLAALRARVDVYILVQYLVFSLSIGACIAFAVASFRSANLASQWRRSIVVGFAAGALPTIGWFVNYLITNVPFTAAFLIAGTAWATTIARRAFGLQRAVMLGVVSATPYLFRHDGLLLVFLFSCLALSIAVVRSAWRWFGGIILGMLACSTVCLALPRAFGFILDPYPYAYSTTLVHDLGGIAQARGRLDEVDRAFLEQFVPVQSLADSFDPVVGDVYVYDNIVNVAWLGTHRNEFIRGYARIVSKNMQIWLKYRLVRALHQLGLLPNWVLTGDCPSPFFLRYCAKSIVSHSLFERVAEWTAFKEVPRLIFWCPAWSIVALLITFYQAMRRKWWELASFAIVPLLYCAMLIPVLPVPNFRYHLYLMPFAIAAVAALLGSRRSTPYLESQSN